MIDPLFKKLGWTRDDVKLVWGQVISGALLVTSGVIDLSAYVTPAHLHLIQTAAIAVLYLSGKMGNSGLPGAADGNKVTATTINKLGG